MKDSRVLITDDGQGTYECSPEACEYTGDLYCQECGYGAGER